MFSWPKKCVYHTERIAPPGKVLQMSRRIRRVRQKYSHTLRERWRHSNEALHGLSVQKPNATHTLWSF